LGGAPGGPYTLEVENPGGGIASSAFVYAAQPDPVLALATPDEGGTGGGTTVTLSGANFTADSAVLFGADPDTGLGGSAAQSVLFVDASTLEVATPSHAKGAVSVVVQDGVTGQAAVLAGGFTFVKSGGGGGGCYVRPEAGSSGDPRALLLGGWWILFLLAAALWMRRGRPVPRSMHP
ncbi:MAG: IPT/TIG domain-containing protein, partial [Candidatus Rokubacteria bacterium]|nr:IPT/TIG domain-containing protein [Candidatus Rokubacteria bacterium]